MSKMDPATKGAAERAADRAAGRPPPVVATAVPVISGASDSISSRLGRGDVVSRLENKRQLIAVAAAEIPPSSLWAVEDSFNPAVSDQIGLVASLQTFGKVVPATEANE
jgi:hypothetical protein